MLNVITQLYIQQCTKELPPNIQGVKEQLDDRNTLFFNNNIISFKVNSSWDEISSSAEIILQRKVRSINLFKGYNKPFIESDTINAQFSIENNAIEKKRIVIIASDKNNETNDINTLTLDSFERDDMINRGDMIRLYAGYAFYINDSKHINTVYNDNFVNETYGFPSKNRSLIFEGYISSIVTDTNGLLTLKCKDYMYFFENIKVSDFNYESSKYTILGDNTSKGILNSIISQITGINSFAFLNQLRPLYCSSYKDKPTIKPLSAKQILTSVDKDDNIIQTKHNEANSRLGDINVQNATFGMLLNEIKSKGWVTPFIYPNSNVINLSNFKYIEEEYSDENTLGFKKHVFVMPGSKDSNIISAKLEYKKLNDYIVGAYVKSVYKIETQETTKNGEQKKKTQPIQIFVGTPGGSIITLFYTKTDNIIPTTQSELDKIKEDMRKWGEQELKNYHYEGYKGSFTTFGIPYVHHGDEVEIKDEIYTERVGIYKVKRVITSGSINEGLRQEIFLDWKINQ